MNAIGWNFFRRRAVLCRMRSAFALLLGFAAFDAAAASSAAFADEHLSVSLVSARDALVPGERNWLGLRLTHAPHWHTYWVNPGDSGLPTKLAWHLPDGFRAGDIDWPAPQRFQVGELYNFGYTGDMVLPIAIDLPATAQGSAKLSVDAKWLVCEEECVPGKATLALELPLRAAAVADKDLAALFAAARAAQPIADAHGAIAHDAAAQIVVELPAGAWNPGSDAFVATTRLVGNAPPHAQTSAGATLLTFAKSEYFTTAPAAFDLLLTQPGAAPRTLRVTFPASARNDR